MSVIQFKNRFGTLYLTPVTDYMPISKITFKTTKAVKEHIIDMECAEKVALITDNRNVQVCFPMQLDFNSCYVIHHNKPDSACVCRVNVEDFQSDNCMTPSQQISALASKYHTSCIA